MKRTYIYFLILSLAMSFACKNNSTQDVQENIIYVDVETLEAKSFPAIIHASGKLSSLTETKLSFKTGGIVNAIFVDEAQKIKKGQVMAELKFDEIYTHLKMARLSYEKAKRDFIRAESLYKDSVATLEQYQDAQTAKDVAASNVKIAEFNLEHSKIIAPANGIVLKQLVEENEMVAQGYPVFIFQATDDEWIVRLGVVDREIVKIQLYDSAKIYMDAFPGKEFYGFVSQIGSMADPYTGTYEVEIQVSNPHKNFVAGFITSIDIITHEQNEFVLVPVNALIEGNEKSAYVYRMLDSIPEKVKVEFDHFDKQFLYVTKGIKQNDKVIVNGAKYISNYTRVRIKE